jgi:hypothetical protein
LGRVVDATALTLCAAENVVQPQLIPMEINLEGWPLFSRQKSPKGNAMEIRQNIGTADGRRLNQLWRVTASHDFSLPGTFDEDVFVGVMALVRRRGGMPEDGNIRFSIYELVKVMRKGKRGNTYEKVREALDRIASTIYYSENAFYVVENESLETYRFTLWTVHFSRAKSTDGRAAEHHTLKFDDIIIRSYNAGYLKLLDTDLYFSLKIPLAKGLYRLIDQRRRQAQSWSVDVRELRDLLWMSKGYTAPSRIWEVLAPAHKVLRRQRFLESATFDGETARYRIHSDFARDWYPEDEPPPTLREEAISALVAHKMWPSRARALVDRFGPEKAFHALDLLSVRGAVDNEGAYVAEVIEHGDAEDLAEMARFAVSQRDRAAGRKPGTQLTLKADGEAPATPGATAPPPPPDPTAQELWERVLADGVGEIDDTSLHVWFESIVPVSLEKEILTISVPNSFAKQYIETRFGDLIRQGLREHQGEGARLEVEVLEVRAR